MEGFLADGVGGGAAAGAAGLGDRAKLHL
jgi:hypothetical protein